MNNEICNCDLCLRINLRNEENQRPTEEEKEIIEHNVQLNEGTAPTLPQVDFPTSMTRRVRMGIEMSDGEIMSW